MLPRVCFVALNPANEFRALMDVNVNGVLYTAQAAGRQMVQYDCPGSIILIASMSGSVTNIVRLHLYSLDDP